MSCDLADLSLEDVEVVGAEVWSPKKKSSERNGLAGSPLVVDMAKRVHRRVVQIVKEDEEQEENQEENKEVAVVRRRREGPRSRLYSAPTDSKKRRRSVSGDFV